MLIEAIRVFLLKLGFFQSSGRLVERESIIDDCFESLERCGEEWNEMRGKLDSCRGCRAGGRGDNFCLISATNGQSLRTLDGHHKVFGTNANRCGIKLEPVCRPVDLGISPLDSV